MRVGLISRRPKQEKKDGHDDQAENPVRHGHRLTEASRMGQEFLCPLRPSLKSGALLRDRVGGGEYPGGGWQLNSAYPLSVVGHETVTVTFKNVAGIEVAPCT